MPRVHFAGSNNQFLVASYEQARLEIIERIAARDRALTLFVAGASIIWGGFIASYSNIETLGGSGPALWSFLLPIVGVLGFAGAHVVNQHHIVIGKIENFLFFDLSEKLRDEDIDFIHWDGLPVERTDKLHSIRARHRVHIVYFAVFPALSLLLFTGIEMENASKRGVTLCCRAVDWRFWMAAIAVLISAALIIFAFRSICHATASRINSATTKEASQ